MPETPDMKLRWSGRSGVPVPLIGQTVRTARQCICDVGAEGNAGRVYPLDGDRRPTGQTYVNAFRVTGLTAVPISRDPQRDSDGTEGILAVTCAPIAAGPSRDQTYVFFGSELSEVYGDPDRA